MDEAKASRDVQIINETRYVLYKRRWYILLTVSVLAISGALQWLAFAPVAYNAAAFYQIEVTTVNFLALVYMIAGVVCGVFSTWIMDTFGLRPSIIACSWFNFTGAIIRIVSALPGVADEARVPLVFLGSVLAALSAPFVLFAPTKLAARWFPKNQRAIANTIASMCNMLGVLLAGILSPILATSKDEILFMLYIVSIPAVLGVIMATVGVCSSEPPTPPSASAESPREPFFTCLKMLLKNKYYWLLCWAAGGGYGLFTALVTLMAQMMCPWGYDDNFVGTVCTVCLISSGLVGAVIFGILTDKTKRYLEIVKTCYSVAVIVLIVFSILHNYSDLRVPVAITLGAFGFFALPTYAIGNELAVETTYPVGEATTAGVLIIIGKVQGFLLVVILSSLGKELPEDFPGQVCTSGGASDVKVYDMSVPTYVLAGYAVMMAAVFVLAFRTKYKRLEADERKNENRSVIVDAESSSVADPVSERNLLQDEADVDETCVQIIES